MLALQGGADDLREQAASLEQSMASLLQREADREAKQHQDEESRYCRDEEERRRHKRHDPPKGGDKSRHRPGK